MVSVMALLPLLLASAFALGTCFYVLKRKSLAQAICIQEATRLQTNLRTPLRNLIRMNPQAQILRERRRIADQNLQSALSSGVPYAIAIAEAADLEVIAEQVAFRARQEGLLAQASALRADGQRSLRLRAAQLGADNIRSRTYYARALAVEAKQPWSITPDFDPIPAFTESQQQRYHYKIDLLEGWPGPRDRLESRQDIECSVSLEGEEKQWNIRILVARASLN
jgi:hypothetical protein